MNHQLSAVSHYFRFLPLAKFFAGEGNFIWSNVEPPPSTVSSAGEGAGATFLCHPERSEGSRFFGRGAPSERQIFAKARFIILSFADS
jgi:hypothetical protein